MQSFHYKCHHLHRKYHHKSYRCDRVMQYNKLRHNLVLSKSSIPIPNIINTSVIQTPTAWMASVDLPEAYNVPLSELYNSLEFDGIARSASSIRLYQEFPTLQLATTYVDHLKSTITPSLLSVPPNEYEHVDYYENHYDVSFILSHIDESSWVYYLLADDSKVSQLDSSKATSSNLVEGKLCMLVTGETSYSETKPNMKFSLPFYRFESALEHARQFAANCHRE